MLVEEVMTPNVATVSPESSLINAAKIMASDDVGWLPILADEKILGVLSDRDLVVRGLCEGRDPNVAMVSQIMSPGVVTCHTTDPVEEAERLMKDHKVRRLLVVDSDEHLAGTLSVGDLAVRLEQPDDAGNVMAEICRND
jgi:CBS domain-containing protein